MTRRETGVMPPQAKRYQEGQEPPELEVGGGSEQRYLDCRLWPRQ